MVPEGEPSQPPTCFECGAPIPQVRLYCGRLSEKGWPSEDGECAARMCSEECGKAHGESHVEKARVEGAKLDEKIRRRAERTGLR